MNSKTKLYITIGLLVICFINVFVYASIYKISNSMISQIKRLDLAYVTPLDYLKLARGLKKPESEDYGRRKLQDTVSDKSYDFITAVFKQDDKKIKGLLDPSAKYIRSKDGSSFIRYIENGIHVEGYMATDKRLIKAKKRWCIEETDHTVICSMEVYIEGGKSPQLWHLHFRKNGDDWRVYMLENEI